MIRYLIWPAWARKFGLTSTPTNTFAACAKAGNDPQGSETQVYLSIEIPAATPQIQYNPAFEWSFAPAARSSMF